MTAATVLRQGEPSGLRPVDPSRDLVRVAWLIQTAFADDLDQAGRSMLRDMRNLGRLGPILWWLDQPNIGISSVLSGFVWVEGGEVVGNITITPVSSGSHRWIISNVAVAKSHQHQGIAQHMMEAAIEYIHQQRGEVVSLQVRDDNLPALHIYESMGFQAVFGTAYLRLDQVPTTDSVSVDPVDLRHRRFTETDANMAYQLARAATPHAVQMEQPISSYRFRLGIEARLLDWIWRLMGKGPALRVVLEKGDHLEAAIATQPATWRSESQIALTVHPASRGPAEKPLISHVLSHLRQWSHSVALVRHPTYHPEGIEAFELFGFRLERTLLWMKHEM